MRHSNRFRIAAFYVATVAVVAAVGFIVDSTAVILTAAALSLPASLIALPGYYLAYGLLALVTGSNSDHYSGSGRCTVTGHCTTTVVGGNPAWFGVAADTLGVLALTLAAIANAYVVLRLAGRRRRTPAPPVSA